MKAQEFLNEYKKINKIIENKLIERDRWRQIALGATPKTGKDTDKVQSQPNPQKMADAVVRYVDIEREIDVQIDRLVDRKNDIVSVIEQLPIEEYNVLHMIYIQDLTKKEIASDLKMSYSWVKTRHLKGLSGVERILDMRLTRDKSNLMP